MDILRKMFKITEEDKKDKESMTKHEFRKPQWFEESETDDELFDDDRKFAFQMFSSPMEFQKHLEQQIQQVLEAVNDFEDNEVKLHKDPKNESKFENLGEFEKEMKTYDTDLDGELSAEQLNSFMQRLAPQNGSIIPGNSKKSIMAPKTKLTDEQIIMGKIHGTIASDEDGRPAKRKDFPSMSPKVGTPFGGVFDGSYQGPKMFGQSIITKTIRKPDGSYETTKIVQDSEGHKKTTTTRTINGKSETITTYNDSNSINTNENNAVHKESQKSLVVESVSDPNICVTKQGYVVPKNLW